MEGNLLIILLETLVGLVETELVLIPCMGAFNNVKVITINERDKSPRTMMLPKDEYQLVGPKQQISSCK